MWHYESLYNYLSDILKFAERLLPSVNSLVIIDAMALEIAIYLHYETVYAIEKCLFGGSHYMIVPKYFFKHIRSSVFFFSIIFLSYF